MPRFLKALKGQFMSWRWPSYRLFLGGQMHPAFPFLLPWLICLIVVAFVLFSFYLFSHFPQYMSYVLWFLFCTVLFFYQRSLFTYQKKKRLEVIAQTNAHKESHLKVTSVVLYNQNKTFESVAKDNHKTLLWVKACIIHQHALNNSSLAVSYWYLIKSIYPCVQCYLFVGY